MRGRGSRIVRLFVVACLGLPLLGLGAASARASRAAPHIKIAHGATQPVFSYKDAIRETVYVQSTMDQNLDGHLDLLATDIIRPKESDDGMKVPTIYEMSPYYQAQGRGNESEIKNEED